MTIRIWLCSSGLAGRPRAEASAARQFEACAVGYGFLAPLLYARQRPAALEAVNTHESDLLVNDA